MSVFEKQLFLSFSSIKHSIGAFQIALQKINLQQLCMLIIFSSQLDHSGNVANI